MNKLTCSIIITFICLFPSYTKSQTLGGYTIYDYLADAVHPNGCDSSFVTGLPDDSIWVNFAANSFMTGTFSMPATDALGDDLLLETGYHPSNYIVSLLLSNGQYSASYNVTLADWTALLPYIPWRHIFNNCTIDTLLSYHFIVPLDFSLNFGLAAADTVTGIKIIFASTTGAPDFAGAYIISSENVGIDRPSAKPETNLFPNPFSDIINITGTQQQATEFILYDIASRKLLQQEFRRSATLITRQYAKGIYFYEMKIKDGPDSYREIKKGKIVKE